MSEPQARNLEIMALNEQVGLRENIKDNGE